MTKTSGVLAAGTLAAALLGVAGCSGTAGPTAPGSGGQEQATTEAAATAAPVAGEAPPLADVWPTALEQAEAAEQVMAKITGSADARVIEAEVAGQLDDSNYQVNATIDDLEIAVIHAEETYFLKGNEAYWETSGAPDPEVLAGEWVEAPESLDVGGVFSLSTLWGNAFAALPKANADLATSAAEITEVSGTAAYHYTLAADATELWISVVGNELLKANVTEGVTQPVEVVVGSWDDAPVIQPPDALKLEDR